MRNILGLALGGSLIFATVAQAKRGPLVVDAPIEKIFIPDGFDDNDNVEVVLHGEFPSSCYNIGNATATVDAVSKKVKVQASALYYPDAICIQTITPFIHPVKLGLVPEGEFKVEMQDDPEVTRTLRVKERTTESPDDFLYAPVDSATIDIDFQTGKQSLVLKGRFPFMFIGCMVMQEVEVLRSPSDTLVVLPKAEIVDGEACEQQVEDRSYTYRQGLSEPFYGEGLLHVRTLHSSSINQLIDIPDLNP